MENILNRSNHNPMERFNHIELENISLVVQHLIELLPRYPFIALEGEMGSGKTTLTVALLKALGILEPEGSPTFSLIQPYDLPNDKVLYHLDAYRINSDEEALMIGLDELFEEDAYFIVEWPEKIINFLPKQRMILTIENTGFNQRNYSIEYGE